MKPNAIKFLLIIVFVGLCLLFPGTLLKGFVYADVVIIGNNAIISDTLTKREVKKIFLGKKKNWADNKEIEFVVLDKSAVHKEFIRKYTQKSTSQFKMYWKQQVFTGKGSTPKSFKNEKNLIDYVADTEGAVGYISSLDGVKNVKIITISDK